MRAAIKSSVSSVASLNRWVGLPGNVSSSSFLSSDKDQFGCSSISNLHDVDLVIRIIERAGRAVIGSPRAIHRSIHCARPSAISHATIAPRVRSDDLAQIRLIKSRSDAFGSVRPSALAWLTSNWTATKPSTISNSPSPDLPALGESAHAVPPRRGRAPLSAGRGNPAVHHNGRRILYRRESINLDALTTVRRGDQGADGRTGTDAAAGSTILFRPHLSRPRPHCRAPVSLHGDPRAQQHPVNFLADRNHCLALKNERPRANGALRGFSETPISRGLFYAHGRTVCGPIKTAHGRRGTA